MNPRKCRWRREAPHTTPTRRGRAHDDQSNRSTADTEQHTTVRTVCVDLAPENVTYSLSIKCRGRANGQYTHHTTTSILFFFATRHTHGFSSRDVQAKIATVRQRPRDGGVCFMCVV